MEYKDKQKFNQLQEFLDGDDVYVKFLENNDELLQKVHELKELYRLHPMSLLKLSLIKSLVKSLRIGFIIVYSVRIGLIIVSSVLYVYKVKNNEPEPIYQKITVKLPEEYRSDLFQLRERWQKKGLSPKEIEYLTYKHLIHIIFGLIRVKIENFSLFRYSSNKDN